MTMEMSKEMASETSKLIGLNLSGAARRKSEGEFQLLRHYVIQKHLKPPAMTPIHRHLLWEAKVQGFLVGPSPSPISRILACKLSRSGIRIEILLPVCTCA